MSNILDAFKVKPFDLEPIYLSWPDAPVFGSKQFKKQKLALDEWLKIIKAGCQARKVPKEYWHRVAQHYMDAKARERLDALKRVVENMTGSAYKWNWHKYKTAMRNLGWELDSGLTETVKVKARPGVWWIVGRGDKDKAKETTNAASTIPTGKAGTAGLEKLKQKNKSTQSLFLNRRFASEKTISRSDTTAAKSAKNSRSKDDSDIKKSSKSSPVKTVAVGRPHGIDESTEVTTTAKAPIWLLNATAALDYLTQEYPKAMTAMSAILITVGTIPAIPAISAGAGGVILASGAAQAVGAVAVGLGSWIKAQADRAETGRPTPTRAHTVI